MKLEFIVSFFYHTTRGDFLKHLQFYGENNSTPFQKGSSWGNSLMGSFTKSPSITLCSPEPSSFARPRGVDRPWVSRFCALLWQLTHTFTICVQISTKRPSNVLFTTENKKVRLSDGAEQGKIVTGVWCWKAVGSFIPSYLILVRKGMFERLLDELVEMPSPLCR